MKFTRTMAAGVLLLWSGSVVFAQDTSQPAQAIDQPTATSPDMMRGMPGGPDTASLPQAGFEMRVGKNSRLKVDCGELALAECIVAAQPLLGRM